MPRPDAHGECEHCGEQDVELYRDELDQLVCSNCDLPDVDPENIYGQPSIRQSIEEDRK